MSIRFHYNGTTVDVSPDWSLEWYKSKLDSYIATDGIDGHKWAWFWLDARSEKVFHFRVDPGSSYAFTQIGADKPDAIDDMNIVN